jgi:hypothetical protein
LLVEQVVPGYQVASSLRLDHPVCRHTVTVRPSTCGIRKGPTDLAACRRVGRVCRPEAILGDFEATGIR